MQKENQLKSCCKKSLSSREVVARDLPHLMPLLLLNRKQQPYSIREAEDPGQKISGMTSLFDNDNDKSGRPRIKCGETLSFQGVGPVFARPARTGAPLRSGFTLIELLVVVLIIGILAAVALPQYKVAVAKARMTQLVSLANAVKQAEERYYLANGEYTNDWSVLDLDLEGTKNGATLTNSAGWGITLHQLVPGATAESASLYDSRLPAYIYTHYDFSSGKWAGKRLCYAPGNNALANKLCKNVSNLSSRTGVNSGEGTNYYLF